MSLDTPHRVLGITLLLMAAALPASARAGDDGLVVVPDRPGYGHSVSVVPERHVQVEVGVDSGIDEAGATITAPLALARYGLLDPIELRLHVPSAVVVVTRTGSSDPTPSPVGVGLKIAVPVGSWGALGALVQLFAPVREREFDADGMTLDLRGLWTVSLGSGFSLGGDVVVDFTRLAAGKGESEREYAASLGVGWSPLSWLGLYLEGHTVILESAARDAGLFVEGGLAFLPVSWLQVDVYAGGDLRDVPDVAYLGAGLSALF